MKKYQRLKYLLLLALVGVLFFATPALAISDSEVQAQVDAVGKESVTGNVLIWFLCAVGFLKVSQKVDSFISSLGMNVGHTGGSLLAETMIAARTITAAAGAAGHAVGGFGGGPKSGPASGGGAAAGATGTSGTGFFKGGLIGMSKRHTTNSAVKTATASTEAFSTHNSSGTVTDTQTVATHHNEASTITSSHSASEMASDSAVRTESGTVTSTEQIMQAGSTVTHEAHNDVAGKATRSTQATSQSTHSQSSKSTSTARSYAASELRNLRMPSIGGLMFARSIATGGSFANDVIGKVAQGDIRSTGSMTGERASQALMSYMGHTALGEQAASVPSYSEVEIGGGRITGVETAPGQAQGVEFGMYHADQYSKPQGEYTTVYSADGAKWYKQYAQDAVERKPYTAPDNTVQYNESIVQRLPDPPKRKDRR